MSNFSRPKRIATFPNVSLAQNVSFMTHYYIESVYDHADVCYDELPVNILYMLDYIAVSEKVTVYIRGSRVGGLVV